MAQRLHASLVSRGKQKSKTSSKGKGQKMNLL